LRVRSSYSAKKRVAKSPPAVFRKATDSPSEISFGLFRRALAAQSGLEIGHKQSGSDAFAGYIRCYQAEPAAAGIKKVVTVSTDRSSGMANAGRDQRSSQRLVLRKQTGLQLLGDGQVVCSLALRLQHSLKASSRRWRASRWPARSQQSREKYFF